MLKSLVLAGFFLTSQTGKPAESGIIVGEVNPPPALTVSEPLQIVLLTPQYADIWSSDVQKRLDTYWERYKPAFAQKKEYFTEISRMAYLDSIQFVVNRMRRDLREKAGAFVQTTSREGRFEFKDVPFGEYKVVAWGRAGGASAQQFIWQESIDVNSPVPQFLDLKTRIP
jgi:hypothetical protein